MPKRPLIHRTSFETLEERHLLAAVPQLVKDLGKDDRGLFIGPITGVKDVAFFRGYTPTYGSELWKSDGTEAGTMLVKDVNPGGVNSLPSDLVNLNGTLLFAAEDGVHGVELWRSDGTTLGTTLVKDIQEGPASSSVRFSIVIGEVVYFVAEDRVHGRELWKSDGTEAGTVLVKDINPGSVGSIGRYFDPHMSSRNGILYFTANDGASGVELWRSDGTESGTMRVIDINPGGEWSDPFLINNVNGTLFFGAMDAIHGVELWKSDGTKSGTVMVKDIHEGGDASFPMDLVNVNGTLYFAADDGPNGRELWKSDGTQDGTVLVLDVFPGVNGSFLNHNVFESLIEANGQLFFVADDGNSGRELWTSDGTPQGTQLVKDINSGRLDGAIVEGRGIGLLAANERVYFRADDGFHGAELWASDGTEAGTVMFDLDPGIGSSAPVYLTLIDNKLFFAATNSEYRQQLWMIDFTAEDDLDGNGKIDIHDLDNMCAALAAGQVKQDDVKRYWSRHQTGPGDADFDHEFDSADLIAVFQMGKYESNTLAKWSEGDWNCDEVFDSADLVAAFQVGWYESDQRPTL